MAGGKEDLKNSTLKGNRNGFTNGLTNGLTNGKTNGLVNGKNGESIKRKSIMETTRGRLGVWAVVGVVLLLIFGAFAFSTNFLKSINWDGIKKYSDIDASLINNPNINITKFAFHQENGNFYFYIEFYGKFSSTQTYKNLAYIFIQDSSSSVSMYNASYLHANYLIKITGSEGAVTGCFMSHQGNENEWNWTVIGGVSVSEKNHVIQGSVDHVFSDDAKIMVVSQSYYSQDITPVVGIEKKSLLVIQSMENDNLVLQLIPLYDEVSINKISIGHTSNVKIENPESLQNIKIKSEKTVKVELYPLANGTAKAWVNGVDADTNFVTIWGNEFKKYYGTTKGIIIDGVFDDWKNVEKKTAMKNVDNPNINIQKYANTTYNGNNYFYLSVEGSMLNGNIAPEMEKVKPSGGGGGGKAKSKKPYDYAEIDFVASDGTSHKIVIWGYQGVVIKKLLDGQDAGNSVKVGVGKDGKYSALEVSLSGYKITSYSVKMTDWNGLQDLPVRSVMKVIDVRALSGWVLVGVSKVSGNAGADLDRYYVGWDDTNLYLNLTTNNTASWSVAYGFALDVNQTTDVGFKNSSSGDSWQRKISFVNANPYLPDYEVYIYWDSSNGITSTALNKYYNGWTGSSLDAAGGSYKYSGTTSNGIQWINITIPWTSIGGKPSTGKIATMAWVAGGNNGDSAVDTVPYDSSVPTGDSWTDWDEVTSMTEVPVPEFNITSIILTFFIIAVPVILWRKKNM